MECSICHASDEDKDRWVSLQKCPICFKQVCEGCGEKSMGRLFCSRRCAQAFFFGDGEEE